MGFESVKAFLVGVLICIGLLFIVPLILFGICYIAGWIASIVIGQWIVAGFALLNISITTAQIPLIAGTLGWIGGFFKATFSMRKGDVYNGNISIY